MNSLNDSELLDLGSASLFITRYLRIDKNNTLSIFMLSGSIQFSIPIQFNTNHAFVKNNAFIQCMCNVKDTYSNTLLKSFSFHISVCDFTYRVNIHDRFSW